MAFRIAGWALFGITCVIFVAAEIWTWRRGTTPSGSPAPFLFLLAITLGLGIAATTARSALMTGLFVWLAIVPLLAMYGRFRERRQRTRFTKHDP